MDVSWTDSSIYPVFGKSVLGWHSKWGFYVVEYQQLIVASGQTRISWKQSGDYNTCVAPEFWTELPPSPDSQV